MHIYFVHCSNPRKTLQPCIQHKDMNQPDCTIYMIGLIFYLICSLCVWIIFSRKVWLMSATDHCLVMEWICRIQGEFQNRHYCILLLYISRSLIPNHQCTVYHPVVCVCFMLSSPCAHTATDFQTCADNFIQSSVRF